MSTIKTFGSVDARSLDQLKRCMEAGDAEFGVLCADHHVGYSQPIGGGIAYEGYVSPSGVGYDIGCGNLAVRTNLQASDVPVDAVTTAGSGVDPHISQANARIQARRVAAVRKLPLARVQQLVKDNTDDRDLGVLGEPGVNVLELNLAVDKEAPAR